MSKEVTEVEGQWNWRSRRFPLPYEGLPELDLPKVRMVQFGAGSWETDLREHKTFRKKHCMVNSSKMGSELTWNESCFSMKRSTSEILEKCCWEAPEPIERQTLLTAKVKTLFLPQSETHLTSVVQCPFLVSTLHHYTPEFNMDTIWYNAWGFHMKYHVQTLIVHPRKLTWNQNIDAWERVSFSSVTCIRSCISIAFQSLKKFQTNSTKTRNTMVGKSWKTKMHFPQIIQIQGIFIEPPGFGVIFADTCSGSIQKSRFKALQIHPWDPRYTCETCNDSRYRCEDETSQHRCAAYVV